MRPSEYVWYVNGYMAELYLKRGLHYTFIIEGGQNNSLYISDEPFGGYSKLEANEKKVCLSLRLLFKNFTYKQKIVANHCLCTKSGL